MTPYEMGKVSAFLLRHRRIEERSERRNIQREERDLAEILRDAADEDLRTLEEMMTGYGFDFITLTAFDVKGIAPGARVYMVARRSNAPCPLLDTNRLIEKMAPSNGKSGTAKIWFTQIWLLHLDLMYSAKDRGPHERNLWLESGFTKSQLIESTREHINGFVRRLNPEAFETSEVYTTLAAEKGADIPRYVSRFLAVMVEAGMLDEIAPDNFRQTLLSAVEMKEGFDRVLGPLMHSVGVDRDPASLAQAAQPLLTVVDDSSIDGDNA